MGSTGMKKNILFVGNPGAGKSTLLNCLMLARDENLPRNTMFKSGISIGEGLTFQFDQRTVKGVTFMDTPGLEDTTLREQAAKAISEALKQSGAYQIVFVVTLESGRVRPQDVTVINLVLDSAKEITRYGVIFNKLTRAVINRINSNPKDKAKLITQASLKTGDTRNRPVPIPFFMQKMEDLEDEEDATMELPELEEFVRVMIPFIEIHKENVAAIEIDKYEKMSKILEAQLKELKENSEKMAKKMEQDRKDYEKRLRQIMEEDKRRHAEEMERMRINNEKHLEMLQRKEKENLARIEEMRKEDAVKHAEAIAKIEASNKQRMEDYKESQERDQQRHQDMIDSMNQQHEQQMEYLQSQNSGWCSIS